MADGLELNLGSGGKTVATDEISGLDYQIIKLAVGPDGSVALVSGNAGTKDGGTVRVVVASDDAVVGAVTETAPATDTASSGLNGRLQRIAQRLTSLIALLPTGLGAGGGLKVDGSGTALPVSSTTLATSAKQDTLAGLVGEVQASPTSNTLLDRLKALNTALTGGSSAPVYVRQADLDPTVDGVYVGTASGAGAVIGTATSGAAVTTDANGTLQQYLRGLVTILGAVTASPVSNSIGDRLKTIATSLAGILSVVGKQTTVTVTPTISATPDYSADDNLGGLMTLTDAMRVSGGSGILQSIEISDHANQGPTLGTMDILIFDSTPAGTYTDNSAFPTLGQAACAKHLGTIHIGLGDWITTGGSAFCTKAGIGLGVTASGSANLYAAVNVKQALNMAATDDLTFRFNFLQN